jgi:hypothetical protein
MSFFMEWKRLIRGSKISSNNHEFCLCRSKGAKKVKCIYHCCLRTIARKLQLILLLMNKLNSTESAVNCIYYCCSWTSSIKRSRQKIAINTAVNEQAQFNGVGGQLHLLLLFMNKLNHTESATFLILQFWAIYNVSILIHFTPLGTHHNILICQKISLKLFTQHFHFSCLKYGYIGLILPALIHA